MKLLFWLSYIKRGIFFFGFHLFKNPKYLFTYALHFFDPNYTFKVDYFTVDEIEAAVKAGKSIIRIGDGEVYYLNKGGLPSQAYDARLREEMFEMVHTYSSESRYLLGFNKVPLETPNTLMRERNLLHSWLPVKVYYDLYLSKETTKYFDASIFYYNDTIPKYFESYLKEKHLIIVSNGVNIEKFKNNTQIPFQSMSYVETPKTQAYASIEEIMANISAEVAKHRNCVVLAACGPASKVIVYRLIKDSVQAIDIGTGLEIAYTDTRIDFMANPFSNQR